MRTHQHPNNELLGAYVLGILNPEEQAAVESHNADCETCSADLAALREMETALGEVPPEAFLDGPPEGGELLLQRTLRQVRTEQAAIGRRRLVTVGLGAAASAAVLFIGGFLAGDNGSASNVAESPTDSARPTPPVEGARVASGTDSDTKAAMTVRITPAVGWIRLNATVTGLPKGERCRLVVVSARGDREIAASWVVAAAPEKPGKPTSLDGSAAVDLTKATSVIVENEQGKQYVNVPL
ncbi:zf-HC2 domain-containing protein [Streptomyces sp. IB201691-2A2]|uniref:zf-HC2 domain-containing protein n=1 Tax=Streptomyces sp. IB201691-2A2 TaxID=2561920 RepID=UPI00117C5532|nr:zf-HC2 domain-containing protein [Streptomyces sp. IB201691-2A2]TRO56019.1 anti-sigma factor [Streptomyces sp. IB201691-2A2]